MTTKMDVRVSTLDPCPRINVTIEGAGSPGKAKQRESLEIQGQTYILAEVVARVDTQVVAQ